MLSRSACEIVWSILSDIRLWKGLCSRDQDPMICPLHTARPGFALPCDFYRKCHIQVMGMQVWVLSSRGRNGMQLSQTLETLWKRYSMSNTDLPQQRWDNIGIVSARRLNCSDNTATNKHNMQHRISTSISFFCAASSQHKKHPSSPTRTTPPSEREPASRDGILWRHQSYLCPLAIQILTDLKQTILRG